MAYKKVTEKILKKKFYQLSAQKNFTEQYHGPLLTSVGSPYRRGVTGGGAGVELKGCSITQLCIY